MLVAEDDLELLATNAVGHGPELVVIAIVQFLGSRPFALASVVPDNVAVLDDALELVQHCRADRCCLEREA